MDDGPVRLFLFIILFLLSGYFAGAEISLASVNKIRIANHAENGDKAAGRVLYILNNFDKALTTLLIGNNIAHAAIATLSTVVTYDIFKSSAAVPDYAVPLCTLITTVAVFFLGEMIPKCFAKACNEKWRCQVFLDTKLSRFYEFSFSNSEGETYPRDECMRFVL